MRNSITDVAGITVGHVQRRGRGWLTGTTAVLCPEGTVGACDVRGGAPGTRETDALGLGNLVDGPTAIVLTGGSAFGLVAADGAMRWLAEHERGYRVTEAAYVVPIVPAAVIFDLARGGNVANRPDATFGYEACRRATQRVPEGVVGAGTGARAGSLKGGLGTASVRLADGTIVAALAVMNPVGTMVNSATGMPWGAECLLPGELGLRAPRRAEVVAAQRAAAAPVATFNTSLIVIATDAALSKPECQRLATVAHDGLAITVRPVHTLVDGDTCFAVATGTRALDPELPRHRAVNDVLSVAATTVARAAVRALVLASSVAGIEAYRDRYPSAMP